MKIEKIKIEAIEAVTIRIDGKDELGIILTEEEFLTKLEELKVVILTDDEKYFTLSDKIPFTNEAIFWCLAVPKLEETEEYKRAEKEYRLALRKYYMFEIKSLQYILFGNNVDKHFIKMWENICEWVNTTDKEVSDDNKVCLITWFEEYWKSWFESIIDGNGNENGNGKYKYMNCTRMVLESFEDFFK